MQTDLVFCMFFSSFSSPSPALASRVLSLSVGGLSGNPEGKGKQRSSSRPIQIAFQHYNVDNVDEKDLKCAHWQRSNNKW